MEEKYNGDCFARGIVCCRQEGFHLVPKAIKQLPKENIWQKGLRMGDNI